MKKHLLRLGVYAVLLAPQRLSSRAECATILQRLINSLLALAGAEGQLILGKRRRTRQKPNGGRNVRKLLSFCLAVAMCLSLNIAVSESSELCSEQPWTVSATLAANTPLIEETFASNYANDYTSSSLTLLRSLSYHKA